MPTLLITGANRGLGFEFVRQFLGDGWDVIASCRNPDKADELTALEQAHGDYLEIYALRKQVSSTSAIVTAADVYLDSMMPYDEMLSLNSGVMADPICRTYRSTVDSRA